MNDGRRLVLPDLSLVICFRGKELVVLFPRHTPKRVDSRKTWLLFARRTGLRSPMLDPL